MSYVPRDIFLGCKIPAGSSDALSLLYLSGLILCFKRLSCLNGVPRLNYAEQVASVHVGSCAFWAKRGQKSGALSNYKRRLQLAWMVPGSVEGVSAVRVCWCPVVVREDALSSMLRCSLLLSPSICTHTSPPRGLLLTEFSFFHAVLSLSAGTYASGAVELGSVAVHP